MRRDLLPTPKSWAHTSLNEVCHILDHRRIPVNNGERTRRIAGKFSDDLYPHYGATGQVGVIDAFIFEGEHILLGEDGAPFLDPFKDKAYLVHGRFWVNNHAHILKSMILDTYVCHYLNTVDYSDHVTGTTRLKLTQSALRAIPISTPSIPEQRRIVAKIEELFSELDKVKESLIKARYQLAVYQQIVLKHAFEGKLTAEWREEKRAAIETSEQLLARIQAEREAQSVRQIREWQAAVDAWDEGGQQGRKPSKPSGFKESVQISPAELTDLPDLPSSWQYARLSELARIGSGMSVSKSRKLADPIEVPYLSVANVQRGTLDLSRVKTMNIERANLHTLELKRWDILFNEGGDRDKLGRGWIWESQIEPCITQNHVFRASPLLDSQEHSKWISHWGNSFGKRYFETQGKQTTNLASINKTVLGRFPIPLPPIEEQVQILRRLDTETSIIDQINRSIATTLEKLDALRQSILKRAFSGQLVAQNPSDEPASVLLDRIRAEREKIAKHESARKRQEGERRSR